MKRGKEMLRSHKVVTAILLCPKLISYSLLLYFILKPDKTQSELGIPG